MTKIVQRFAINRSDSRQQQEPFVQRNKDGSFTFSNGTEGIQFVLSEEDVSGLLEGGRRILLEQPGEDELA